ncbi:MAG TPA: hypothetical protein DDX40_00875 [Rikenellaceae bacterium]|nr:hypothetical protein [Rikenellaceae bacterium]
MAKTFHSLKDLKGLIPKNEPVKAAVQAKKREKPVETAKAYSDPKVGDRVVLMESDAHGRIQRIDGKTYFVKLDDGMVVRLGKWDFAVTDDKEEERLRNSIFTRRRPDSLEEPSKPRYTDYGEITVDLHLEALARGRSIQPGQALQYQIDAFKTELKKCLPHRGMRVRFITGVGDYVLTNAIRKELDEVYSLRCTYTVGTPGVTVVTVR